MAANREPNPLPPPHPGSLEPDPVLSSLPMQLCLNVAKGLMYYVLILISSRSWELIPVACTVSQYFSFTTPFSLLSPLLFPTLPLFSPFFSLSRSWWFSVDTSSPSIPFCRSVNWTSYSPSAASNRTATMVEDQEGGAWNGASELCSVCSSILSTMARLHHT